MKLSLDRIISQNYSYQVLSFQVITGDAAVLTI